MFPVHVLFRASSPAFTHVPDCHVKNEESTAYFFCSYRTLPEFETFWPSNRSMS